MKKHVKIINILCVLVLVISTMMLFTTNTVAYSGTGDYYDPMQLSTFSDGDPLPDGDGYYINDLPFSVYWYSDQLWADLYLCVNDQAPFSYATRINELVVGQKFPWATYNNQFEEHPVIRLFLCTHDVLSPVAIKAPTCKESGIKIDHYKCDACGWLFYDESGTNRIYDEGEVIDPIIPHANIERVAEKNATCTGDGCKDHYKCGDCGTLLSDEEGTTEITEEDLILPATGHISKVLVGKAATYDATGLTDGEICETCGTVLVEQKMIPKLKKDTEPDKEENTGFDSEKKSPKTSDVLALYICLAIALISFTSVSVVLKRKYNA